MFKVRRICYIIAPMTIYKSTKKYFAKIERLKAKYPVTSFVLPHDSYDNNQDWLNKIPDIVKSVDFAILLTNKGIIGYGCFIEMILLAEAGKRVYLYHKDKLTESFSIELLSGDWKKYALVKAD